jgi:hypothetical protein
VKFWTKLLRSLPVYKPPLEDRSREDNLERCETPGGICPENMEQERFRWVSLERLPTANGI